MGPQPTGEPRSVAVFGSCPTRDNFNSRFNPGYKRRYDVRLAANQTSVITMMSPPVDEEFTPTGQMSEYDQWNVRSDLSREFLPELVRLKPDYLILDFFADVHFGVLRLDDGRYLTDNRWKLWRTDLYERLEASNGFTRLRIFDDADAYVATWAEALDRFAGIVAAECPETTVVVHRGFNTGKLVPPGSDRPVSLTKFQGSRLPVRRANRLWARLDDHAISTYGWDAIDLRDEGYMTTADHPWGPFWVHYTLDYYPRFLAELELIDLRRTLDPEHLERVEAIADAGRQHSVRYARQWRRTHRAQQQRIKELENLGMVDGVRYALGRRRREARARRRTSSAPAAGARATEGR